MVRESKKIKKLAVLLLAFLGMAAFVVIVHRVSPALPGPAGEVFRNNQAKGVEATALIYTESGDVNDYLDRTEGKYWLELDWQGHIETYTE